MSQIIVIDKDSRLVTPIYAYIKKNYQPEARSMNDILGNEKFVKYFGSDPFELTSSEELHQLLFMNFSTSKAHVQIAKEIVTKAAESRGLDNLLKGKDQLGLNLMHVSDGRFADQYWKGLVEDKKLETLQDIARELCKKRNKAG